MSSLFEIILSRVTYRLILGTIVFSMFLNNLLLCLTNSDLLLKEMSFRLKIYNDLLQTLGKNSDKAIDWFNNNHITAIRQISSHHFSSQVKLQAARHSN